MKTAEDIESYLLKLGVPYEQVKPGIWVLQVPGVDNFVVSMAGPVVVFRVKVMDLPGSDREGLFRALLSLNTSEMVHGAFGLEGDSVVIVHALELENLDLNEIQAVIDDVSMAISKQYPALAQWSARGAGGAPAQT
jgi:Tir chaperone family protein CesT